MTSSSENERSSPAGSDMIRPKDIVARLSQLDEKSVCEMYSRLLPRAMETNPLKSWVIRMNPTSDDLKEVLMTLPPSDMSDIEDIWFS